MTVATKYLEARSHRSPVTNQTGKLLAVPYAVNPAPRDVPLRIGRDDDPEFVLDGSTTDAHQWEKPIG